MRRAWAMAFVAAVVVLVAACARADEPQSEWGSPDLTPSELSLMVGRPLCEATGDMGLNMDSMIAVGTATPVPVSRVRLRGSLRVTSVTVGTDSRYVVHIASRPDTSSQAWLSDHKRIIRSRGAAPCFSCHQETFCSFCHVREASQFVQTSDSRETRISKAAAKASSTLRVDLTRVGEVQLLDDGSYLLSLDVQRPTAPGKLREASAAVFRECKKAVPEMEHLRIRWYALTDTTRPVLQVDLP